MRTRILFFGALSARLGSEREIEIPDEGCSVADLRRLISAQHADAAEALSSRPIKVAVDQEIVGEDAHVMAGQEIAFLSPLSGG
jgi:molybdopterin converting factor small subunit